MTGRHSVITVLVVVLAIMGSQLPGLGIGGVAILVAAVFLVIMSPILLLRGLVRLVEWLAQQV